MKQDLGRQLSIRATAYVAGEAVPFFWPMRTFVKRNPLHGLEHLAFEEALAKGADLFRARTFLSRGQYQAYLAGGKVSAESLEHEIAAAIGEAAGEAKNAATLPGIDLGAWVKSLLTGCIDPLSPAVAAKGPDLHAALHGAEIPAAPASREAVEAELLAAFPDDRPLYEAIDALFGTELGERLDGQVIRACLAFFDEGQSVWSMPDRSKGFFTAWRNVAPSGARRVLAEVEAGAPAGTAPGPERVIDHVLSAIGVPSEARPTYLTREMMRLQGWSGFIRWRAQAKRYYWSQEHPGDLVDLLAVRCTLGMALMQGLEGCPVTVPALRDLCAQRPFEMALRRDYHERRVPAPMIRDVQTAVERGKASRLDKVASRYLAERHRAAHRRLAGELQRLGRKTGQLDALMSLGPEDLAALVDLLSRIERREGMIWLRASEATALDTLMGGLTLTPPPPRDKRPFVQAAFCIDVRSERIRRHLEGVGDYQTFGIAGFFGVPASLLELGKGSEKHLCPVLLTPRNLVLEMSAADWSDEAAVTLLDKVMHELKETVISPFVTVEAIGLLFGLDMIGKTLAPQTYHRLRERLDAKKPRTHLILDKLSREQADSIVRAVQRAVIIEAAEHELGLPTEDINDAIVRELREYALKNAEPSPDLAARLKTDEPGLAGFVEQLREVYRINRGVADMQMEHLGRVGFGLEEQVMFVQQALSSIGLSENFSRFVLLVGHGSTSENNAYESSLDCGACGGNDGLSSARILANMANKHTVRRRLAEKGIEIPDDTWFLPAMHNTTTDEIALHDLELLPATHLVYLDRLRVGLASASRLCAQERLPALGFRSDHGCDPRAALRGTQRNAVDWSQVRPEWGLSGNAYFVIGRRDLTRGTSMDGRAFLHSYDYRLDPKRRLLENILTGPLVVGQWINLEHYFSTVDNDRLGAGSKVYQNVTGQFGVMTGNLSDLRTGLPSQTVLNRGQPYHQPLRLTTLIEAPFDHAMRAINGVASVKRLVLNGWIRMVILDPVTGQAHVFDESKWITRPSQIDQTEDLVTR
ncbi:DUF2309 domain-containing protein [Brevirhabdus pacifica]|uniref:Probable inorganic carbon transporter subunit DabA n=1 Tax=Brevirhabdus pacifica TaxID=1267768 RepID=A0A1U7DJ19_9RHOB|nr:DUF2309 domain-containing protein [Brevirhabdus pacifica]APX89997.1 DUF2309 domain-containing protein [Brevirhabdus pacifica]OWU75404.1 membrane protein [Loktanella sp. 22II-4b]PJJ82763.1 hypothetical protein CLV77_2538 [Brevirhabdus pacifica]